MGAIRADGEGGGTPLRLPHLWMTYCSIRALGPRRLTVFAALLLGIVVARHLVGNETTDVISGRVRALRGRAGRRGRCCN
jgi:hypothetical protein